MNNFDLSKCKFFDDTIRSMISIEGKKIFNSFKGKKKDVMLGFLNQLSKENKNITLEMADEEWVNKNLQDILFIYDKTNFLSEKDWRELSQETLPDLQEIVGSNYKRLDEKYFQFKENGKWSLINKFDNNIKLWRKSILDMYQDEEKYRVLVDELNDCYIAIKAFFTTTYEKYSSFDLTYGEFAFLMNLSDKLEEAKSIVMGTTGTGDEHEINFLRYMIEVHGAVPYEEGRGNIYHFGSDGGLMDKKGIDFAIKYKNIWVPVQVKNDYSSAKKSVPKSGISVYPTNGLKIVNNKLESVFKFFRNKNSEPENFKTDFKLD